MSVKQALEFIQQVERLPELKKDIRSKFADRGLIGIIQAGTDRQLVFDEQELRTAFSIDWTMRVLHASSCFGHD